MLSKLNYNINITKYTRMWIGGVLGTALRVLLPLSYEVNGPNAQGTTIFYFKPNPHAL